MDIQRIHSLSEISPDTWNQLTDDNYPFIRHEFLYALEQTGCVDADSGWLSQHIVVKDHNQVIAIMPMYTKMHSKGEYVFDHQWTYAYRQHGIRYFPKWVSAIPFTPCQDKRIFVDSAYDETDIINQVLEYIKAEAETCNISSWHCLFPNSKQANKMQTGDFIPRQDVQFQWRNRNYQDFNDFLTVLNSKYRKKIKRERRRIAESDIVIECLNGKQINESQLHAFYQFYLMTYAKNGMQAYLSEDFFFQLLETLADQVLLVLASKNNKPVGAALSLIGAKTLYGRYWGCFEAYHSLHFEACFYQGIEYCINNGLQIFDSGAQGQHKLARGFEPIITHSVHWFKHPEFAAAIRAYLQQETSAVKRYQSDAGNYLPFKRFDSQG